MRNAARFTGCFDRLEGRELAAGVSPGAVLVVASQSLIHPISVYTAEVYQMGPDGMPPLDNPPPSLDPAGPGF